MIYISIIYSVITGQVSYGSYTDLEYCRDITQSYAMQETRYIVDQTCKPFNGTREEFVKQLVMEVDYIETERL